jgi:hypothetical protein
LNKRQQERAKRFLDAAGPEVKKWLEREENDKGFRAAQEEMVKRWLEQDQRTRASQTRSRQRWEEQADRLKAAEGTLDMLKKAGVEQKPAAVNLWRRSLSRHGNRSRELIHRLYGPIAAASEEVSKLYVPNVNLSNGPVIDLGAQHVLGSSMLYPSGSIRGHARFEGCSGCGKTTAMNHVAKQYVGLGTGIDLYDTKSIEGWKLQALFPDAAVVNITQLLWNPLAYIGNPVVWANAILGAFGEYAKLTDNSVRESVKVLIRIYSGLRPEDPCPSVIDFTCVINDEAKRGKPMLKPVGAALESFAFLMGDSARLRKVPRDYEEAFRVVVFRCNSTDQSLLKLIVTWDFIRSISRAAVRGVSDAIERLLLLDEANSIAAREVATVYGKGVLSIGSELLTKIRATSKSLLLGFQSIIQTDKQALANTDSVFTFRLNNPEECEMAALRHGLPRKDAALFLKLPVGVACVSAPGWERCGFVRFPKFSLPA